MIATKWKWNEHKVNMKKFQNWDVGALFLWKDFSLTDISQTFRYGNWQILMTESAFHFCGRLILITNVFHIPKSTSAGDIANFFRVCYYFDYYSLPMWAQIIENNKLLGYLGQCALKIANFHDFLIRMRPEVKLLARFCLEILVIPTRKKSAILTADVDFGMKKEWMQEFISHRSETHLIHQNLSIFITKSLWNFCQTKNSPQNQGTYISVLELFHIKFMFISFSLCCNHFTSMAYEILYAIICAIYHLFYLSFDKIKEVVLPTFSVYVEAWKSTSLSHASVN
jgi:hypothetical protein